MSNPTTPFSWQMPQNTDLVTDLPADFEVFGQAVATSMQDLLGGTTGQILSKTSNTDMDFTWIANDQGDITGVTAGTGISGGGTSGNVTVTNSMATAFTTSGDLIQATGSGTFARLGTGTNGQYLTTNGTTNSWGSISAGGMTLLATATPSGASSLSFTSISGSYTNLLLRWDSVFQSATGSWAITLNNDTSANYQLAGTVFQNQTASTIQNASYTKLGESNNRSPIGITGTSDSFAENSYGTIEIFNYSDTTMRKYIKYDSISKPDGTSAYCVNINATYNSTSAITSIEFVRSSTQTITGKLYLYGVK